MYGWFVLSYYIEEIRYYITLYIIFYHILY